MQGVVASKAQGSGHRHCTVIGIEWLVSAMNEL